MLCSQLIDLDAEFIEKTGVKGAYRCAGDRLKEASVGITFGCPKCGKKTKDSHAITLLFEGKVLPQAKPEGRWEVANGETVEHLTLTSNSRVRAECGLHNGYIRAGKLWWM